MFVLFLASWWTTNNLILKLMLIRQLEEVIKSFIQPNTLYTRTFRFIQPTDLVIRLHSAKFICVQQQKVNSWQRVLCNVIGDVFSWSSVKFNKTQRCSCPLYTFCSLVSVSFKNNHLISLYHCLFKLGWSIVCMTLALRV